MIRVIVGVFAILFLAVTPWTWGGEGDELHRVISHVQKRYESTREFQASFEQASTVKALNRVQHAEGEVWFKKPGKMRWNYYKPSRDEIVSDGKKFWYYYRDDNQVVETSLDQVVDNPSTATFLQGLGNIGEEFKARFPDNGGRDKEGNYLIQLVPKDNSGDEVNKFTIVVDPKSWLVKMFYLYDPFGNVTTVTFKDIKINKGIADSLFTFRAPKGVEVIRAPR